MARLLSPPQTDGFRAAYEIREVDTLAALEDLIRLDVEGYVPVYRDENNGVLAVNSVAYPRSSRG